MNVEKELIIRSKWLYDAETGKPIECPTDVLHDAECCITCPQFRMVRGIACCGEYILGKIK